MERRGCRFEKVLPQNAVSVTPPVAHGAPPSLENEFLIFLPVDRGALDTKWKENHIASTCIVDPQSAIYCSHIDSHRIFKSEKTVIMI
jgi:hypothetical protein